MKSYTDQELEQLLTDVESDWVERKESFKGDAPNTVREAVCAFANDLPNYQRPGVIFIGAKDNGAPSGVAITDELLRQLADIKTDGNVLPLPTLTVSKQTLNGAEIATLIVQPADSPPVRYRGRIFIRIGPRRGIASAQDERILNEKRRFRDRPFDVQPILSSTVEDLDQRLFETEYLPAAFAPDILEANDRSYEQRLAATKMVLTSAQPIPTVLGVLVIAKKTRDFLPGAYIQFLRIAGDSLGAPIIDEYLIDGTIEKVIRRIDEKMISHNRTAVDFVGVLKEQRTHLYPMAALQQLVRNALLHRTYESTNTPVRVYWFDDRIEITNPGGAYGVVTQANFGESGVTDYRNPNLAEALRVLGFVQRFGAGIPIARRALATNGNPPPEFRVEPTYITATVRPTA
jgi:ATP-dependent DNA helicase RecG